MIDAPVDKVWDVLVNVKEWETWNPYTKSAATSAKLQKDTPFSWGWNGHKHRSTVRRCRAPFSLAWTSHTFWIRKIIVWELEDSENKTIATLSASMQGLLIIFMNSHVKVHDELIEWLELLKMESER